MAEEETKFVELMFGAKVAIADWPLPVGHRPLKHFARIPVLFRIGGKPRTACRPQTACGRHCPWEPTALHETGATTTVAPAAFSGFDLPPYRNSCHRRTASSRILRPPFFRGIRVISRQRETVLISVPQSPAQFLSGQKYLRTRVVQMSSSIDLRSRPR